MIGLLAVAAVGAASPAHVSFLLIAGGDERAMGVVVALDLVAVVQGCVAAGCVARARAQGERVGADRWRAELDHAFDRLSP